MMLEGGGCGNRGWNEPFTRVPKTPRKHRMYDVQYLAFSFLCIFVPWREKSIERTFDPVELSFCGTFAPGERKVQELSFHGTFAHVPPELSLLMSECYKNFRSMELSHP